MATRRKSAGKQRLYRMKGCNKKGCKKTKRRHLGGSPSSYPNAYPNPGPAILPESNLFLNSQLQRGGSENALVGKPWTPNLSSWPGVDGVNGNGNHYPLNTFENGDIQLDMKVVGAQPPFLGGGKKKNKRTKKQRGGNLSNFLSQDLINLGRQFQYGLGTAYNGITGYAAPVSPLPWKGQFQSVPNLATVKAAMM